MMATKFLAGTMAAACIAGLALVAPYGAAQSTGTSGTNKSQAGQAHANHEPGKSEEKADATQHINKALQTVQQMKKDAQVTKLMQQSKGIFIVPDYGRAAIGVGGQGGAGVLVVHPGGKWTGPGFYNFGGVSIGAQAGVSAGAIALLLMDDKALNSFASNNKFALNADAGLSIVNYSARATGSAGHGDIVVWSDTEGAFANVSLGITDVNFDENETRALYNKNVAAKDIITGKMSSPQASALLKALP